MASENFSKYIVMMNWNFCLDWIAWIGLQNY